MVPISEIEAGRIPGFGQAHWELSGLMSGWFIFIFILLVEPLPGILDIVSQTLRKWKYGLRWVYHKWNSGVIPVLHLAIDLVNTVMAFNAYWGWNECRSLRCPYSPGTRWLKRKWFTTPGSVVPQALLGRLPGRIKIRLSHSPVQKFSDTSHCGHTVCAHFYFIYIFFLNFVNLDFVLVKHVQILFDLATYFQSTAVLDIGTTPTKLTMVLCRFS